MPNLIEKSWTVSKLRGLSVFGQNLEISVIVCVVDQTSFIEGRTIGAQLGAGALLRKTPFV